MRHFDDIALSRKKFTVSDRKLQYNAQNCRCDSQKRCNGVKQEHAREGVGARDTYPCSTSCAAGNNYARESPRACVGAYIVTKRLWPESFPQSLRDLDSLKTYIRPSRRRHEALLVPRRRGAVSADAPGRLLCAATRELLEGALHSPVAKFPTTEELQSLDDDACGPAFSP
ncbi:hypothetical protein EVAR_37844_1 [Eumeta japonica]|uniref:Uncharacterized protein n=1 Tax=Eumeta variegata TaxID=151549 RepID=A0A4C1X4I9_EUMVA|nr:hypothetical protein EVAR_37844_1 [Eumeta japonica]